MESFSDRLRAEAAPIWGKIFAHPFLKEIKEGTLPLETFQYYLAQDYLYLEGFARTVAVALSKAPNSNLLEELGHRVLTPIERPLHHKLVEAAGMTMEDVRGASPSPTNTVMSTICWPPPPGMGWVQRRPCCFLARGPTTCCGRKWDNRNTRSTGNGRASTCQGYWKGVSRPGGASWTGWPVTPVRLSWRRCDTPL